MQLIKQYLHILQEIEKNLNRKEFCKLHNISESKLSRILSGKIQPDLETFDYLCMSCNFKIEMRIINET